MECFNGPGVWRPPAQGLKPRRHEKAWHHAPAHGREDKHPEGRYHLSLLSSITCCAEGQGKTCRHRSGKQTCCGPGRWIGEHVDAVDESCGGVDQDSLHETLSCKKDELPKYDSAQSARPSQKAGVDARLALIEQARGTLHRCEQQKDRAHCARVVGDWTSG